jgi:O-antigen ligase
MKAMNAATPFSPVVLVLLPVALLLGVALSVLNPLYSFVIAAAIGLGICLMLRLDAFIAALIIAVHIVIDAFMGLATYQPAMLLAVTLLAVCYLGRSKERPWTAPNLYWLWIPFLIWPIMAVLEGGKFSLTNSIGYYLPIVFSGFLMFWLGNNLSRDTYAIRRIFQCLAMIGAILAMHTVIEATTGVFLLKSLGKASAADAVFILDTGNSRLGSFFLNPNGNGMFLATFLFIPLGLFMETKNGWSKVIHLGQALIILLALVETYSTGSWLGTLAGLVLFILLLGRMRDSVLLTVMLLIMGTIGAVVLQAQIAAQFAHSSDTSSSSLHMATWQTATRVMLAYPWFGVGLGNQAYLHLAEPLRVYGQTKPLQEPDNSYLQWGATCGIPMVVIFLSLLGSVFLSAFRNWLAVNSQERVFFAIGIASLIALSVCSLFVDGWTSPIDMPFPGWLIAGIIATPFIRRYRQRRLAAASGGNDAEQNLVAKHNEAESTL